MDQGRRRIPSHTEPTFEEAMKVAEEAIPQLQTYLGHADLENNAFYKLISAILAPFFNFDKEPISIMKTLRQRTASLYIKNAIPHTFTVLLNRSLDQYLPSRFRDERGKIDPKKWKLTKIMMSVMQNFSNDVEFGNAAAKEPEYLRALIRIQEEFKDAFFQNQLEDELTQLILSSINMAYNLVFNDVTTNVIHVRESNMVESVKPYLASEADRMRTAALLFSSHVVTEKEAELFLSNESSIDFLIDHLSTAMKNDYRQAGDYWAEAILKGLERLAKNDSNKRLIVDRGILPYLKELIASHVIEEREYAYLTLWTLAFDPSNAKRISDELGDILNQPLPEYHLKPGDDPDYVNQTMKKIEAHRLGVLWELKQKRDSLPNSPRNVSKPPVKSHKHIMISYNWSHKPIILQVRDELKKNNFKVWIDVEHMEVNTLDSMASAVENASLILVAMSKKYKDSQNCRSEAEYAYKRGKTIIPLVVEPKYRPDGWLGLMTGTKLYYDISGKYPFEEKMDELLEALYKAVKAMDDLEVPSLPPIEQAESSSKPSQVQSLETSPRMNVLEDALGKNVQPVVDVADWSSDRVQEWCNENNIDWRRCKRISGKQLGFLKKLKTEAPEAFYRRLESIFGVKSVKNISNFTMALDSL